MIYGKYDIVPKLENLGDFVADLQVAELDCGHWIQQERPEQTTELILNWLQKNYSR